MNRNLRSRWQVRITSCFMLLVSLIVSAMGNESTYAVSSTEPLNASAAVCTIISPPNITVPSDSGRCGAVVLYPAPTTSGGCGPVVSTPPSGFFFPLGTTTVICTEATATNVSFTVTVTGGNISPAVLRDDFNRANSPLAGSNKWALLLNQPGTSSLNVVNSALQAVGTNYTSSDIVWDSLMTSGSEASIRVAQKSGNYQNSSFFIYARMNGKNHNTGTGYRMRYWEQSGADLIEIHRVGTTYGNFSILKSTTREIQAGDLLTFRVLCDNKTMVALVNGAEVLRATDATYNPAQWYFTLRAYVFPTPVRFDDFMVSPSSPGVVLPPTSPALLSPLNGAMNQPITLTLSWNASSGAASYRVQVSTDSLFGTQVVDDSTVIGTSKQIGPLLFDTKYFWRVNAKNNTGTSAYSSPRNFTTRPLADTALHHYEYVFPDGWIYMYDIDNGHTFVKRMSVPTTTGVRGVTASPTDGMIYLSFGGYGGSTGNGSLVQYNLLTETVGWIKNYSHGTDSHAMTADGTTIFMPSGTFSTDGVWYVVNASDGSEKGLISTPGVGPHNTIVSLDGTHVYLGNRDIVNRGHDSLYVASTSTYQITKSVGQLLGGVRPFTINGTETFAFVTIAGFLGFQVCDLTNSRVAHTIDLTTMGFPCGTPCGSTPSHGISLSPDEREIYVIDLPNQYIHVFDVSGIFQNIPPQKVADIQLQHPLTGSDSACALSCVREGWLQHSRDGRYVYVGDAGDVISTATRSIVAYLPSMRHTRKTLEIDWQNDRPVFTTTRTGLGYAVGNNAPSTPTLLSPPNNSPDQPTTTTLRWNPATWATSYRVQLATDSLFVSILHEDSTVASTSTTVGPLLYNADHFWRVKAKNSVGTSPFSTVWKFSTTFPGPGLISPPNNSTGQPTALVCRWSSVLGASGYRFQLATDSVFASKVIDDSTLIDTSRQVSGLGNSTKYYWRVNARMSSRTGEYSSVWNFTTLGGAPPIPAPLLPVNGAACLPTTVSLSWSTVTSALTYNLQVATDSMFNTKIVDDSTLTTASKQISSLAGGTIYYWRVRSKNANGSSPFSGTWNFTTFLSAVLRDDFNRPNAPLPGVNKWVTLLNQPGSGSIAVVTNAIQATNTLGVNNSGGVAWDSLMTGGTEVSLTVVQKSANYNYSSLFIYARMNNKDYGTGSGYRLRYWEKSGTDLIEIHRVSSGYSNYAVLASTSIEIKPGDVITFRVLCDNRTMVGLINGVQVVQAIDATYQPGQWYFAFRSYVFTTPARFDDFKITSRPAIAATSSFAKVRENASTVPTSYRLEQNFPNPFNPITTIRYELPKASYVTLRVYDVLGQEVEVLVDGMQEAGYKTVEWSASKLPSSVYFYRLQARPTNGSPDDRAGGQAGTFVETKKLLLMK